MSTSINFDPQLVDFATQQQQSWANQWLILPVVDGMDPKTIDWVHTLNSLGSLFYFSKVVLRKRRFTEHLHKDICDSLEKDNLKEVLEIPRDHFKSTICSEAFPMWRALPFLPRHEAYMRALGYADEFIRWMKYAHNQDARNLLVSANITNAAKLGRRIDFHYNNNGLFRGLFPEILPEKSDLWSSFSMTQKRSKTATSAQGEGTFDFLGVGAALQSRHYDLIIEDDLVGMDALDSELVMQGIIDYHKLLVGAFDSVEGRPDLSGDEIVVGNRWQYEDLNAYLRKFEKEFNVTTHSAVGGCCSKHSYGTPIFPEEFSLQRLRSIQERLGTYYYSCFPAEAPILMSDFSEKQIKDIVIGDVVIGYKKGIRGTEQQYANLVKSIVLATNIRKGHLVKMTTNTGREIICTWDHLWWKGRWASVKENRAEYTKLEKGSKIFSIYKPYETETPENQRWLDWLGGIIDAEGSLSANGSLFISQSKLANPEICMGIEKAFCALNLSWEYLQSSQQYYIKGGRQVKLRILSNSKMFKLNRWFDNLWRTAGQIIEENGEHEIVSYEYIGEHDVYNIQTESENYISYGYATKNCQYINSPAPPGDEKFKESNLRWFSYERFLSQEEGGIKINTQGEAYGISQAAYKIKIIHEIRKGEVIKDILPTHLERAMIIDPAHVGKDGRSRHAIIIMGFSNTPVRQYLLEVWAETNDYSALVNKIYELGEKWKIRIPYCEGIAFQKFLSYHFDTMRKYRKKDGKWVFDKVDTETLKTDRSKDGKEKRIESMSPVYDRGEFWCCKVGCNSFLEEYRKYPYSKFKDVLDTLGYSLQIWKPGKKNRDEVIAWLKKSQNYRDSMSADTMTGY